MEDRSEKYHYAILKDGKEEIVYWFKGLKYPYSRGYCHQVYQYLAPVPSYEEWQAKLKENAQLKEQINHVLRTQAKQFVDNQKLQVKAEKQKMLSILIRHDRLNSSKNC